MQRHQGRVQGVDLPRGQRARVEEVSQTPLCDTDVQGSGGSGARLGEGQECC